MGRTIGRLWLDGSFGIGYCKKFMPPALVPEHESTEHERWNIAAMRVHGIEVLMDFVRENGAKPKAVAPMDSPMLSNSHKLPKPRGSKGISSMGRKMVRCGVILLEREFSVGSLSFVTLTLPGCTKEEYRAFFPRWTECQRQIQQWIRRQLSKLSTAGELVSVVEIQEKRYKEFGVPAAHLHIVFRGRRHSRAEWIISPEALRRAWLRILNREGIPGYHHSSASINPVRKSAVRYLSKYMSKGIKCVESLIENGWSECIPSSWWAVTLSLRKRVRAAGRYGEDVGVLIMSAMDDGKFHLFESVQPIKIALPDEREIIVGYSGRLSAKNTQSLIEEIDRMRTKKI